MSETEIPSQERQDYILEKNDELFHFIQTLPQGEEREHIHVLAEEIRALSYEPPIFYKGVGISLTYLGHAYRKLYHDYPLAIHYYQQVLELEGRYFQADKLRRMCLRFIAESLLELGNYPKALEYTLKVSEGIVAIEDQAFSVEVNNTIQRHIDLTEMYTKMQQHVLAEKHLDIAESLIITYHADIDAFALTSYYNTLADSYMNLDRLDKALEHINQAINLMLEGGWDLQYYDSTKNHDSPKFVYTVYHLTKGEIFIRQEDYATANDILMMVKTGLEDMGIHQSTHYFALLCALAQVNLGLGDLELALDYGQQALKFTLNSSQKLDMIAVKRLLVRIHRERGEFAVAFTFSQEARRSEQEIFNAEADQRARSFQVLHETDMARNRAAFLQSENEALEAEIDERIRAQKELEHSLKSLQNTQQELVEKEKLASLGSLMGEIARRIIPPVEMIQASVDSLDSALAVWGRTHKPLAKGEIPKSLSPLLESSEAIKDESREVAGTIAMLKGLLKEEEMSSDIHKGIVKMVQRLD